MMAARMIPETQKHAQVFQDIYAPDGSFPLGSPPADIPRSGCFRAPCVGRPYG